MARVVSCLRSVLREVEVVVEEVAEEVVVMDVSNVAKLVTSPGSLLSAGEEGGRRGR